MTKVGALGFAIAVLLLLAWSVQPGISAPAQAVSGPLEPVGDAVRGEALFQQASFRGTPGCSTCHSLEPGVKVVGPSLAGAGTRARTLLGSPAYKGLASTPEQLLGEAILTRQCDLWGGSTHLVIPEWEGVLERQELADLTAFLASLK